MAAQFSRDWFVERFGHLVDDVWAIQLRGMRSKLKWTNMSLRSEVDSNVAREMRLALDSGVKVSRVQEIVEFHI